MSSLAITATAFVKAPTVSMPTAGITAIGISAVDAFSFKASAVKTTPVEITGIISLEERTIVFIVHAVTKMSVPGGVVIIGIPGKFVFIDQRGGCISIL